MSKQRQQNQPAVETVDENLLEQALASTVAKQRMDEVIAKRIEMDSRIVYKYVPIAGNQEITVTTERTNRIIPSSKNGNRPPRLTIEEFNQTCAQLRLNPYMRDIYLIGYDKMDGPTTWSIIISVHALRKRADENPQYDGIESGLVVLDDKELKELNGTVKLDHQKIVGGWCRIHRKDRSVPVYVSVSLSEREKNFGEWKNQKAWMITKCAIAAGFREAFPRDMGGGYETDAEMDRKALADAIDETAKRKPAPSATMDALTKPPAAKPEYTIGRLKGELSIELRRADTPEAIDEIRKRFESRAGGEVDKLAAVEEMCDRAIAKFTTMPEEPPVARRPETPDEEHGDAWEGEDVAAIEEQIARES